MDKTTLRKIYKQKRKNLTREQILELQDNIYNQVFSLDFSGVQVVHIFLPIKLQKEIDTFPIVNYLRSNGRRISISKSDFSTNTLEHFAFDEDTELEINKYGIPEPVNSRKIDVKEIDLVFVPLLISDRNNYRVGYGKGFYDRFLSGCKAGVKTIGLNFFPPVSQIEKINEFDVPLDVVIYPKK